MSVCLFTLPGGACHHGVHSWDCSIWNFLSSSRRETLPTPCEMLCCVDLLVSWYYCGPMHPLAASEWPRLWWEQIFKNKKDTTSHWLLLRRKNAMGRSPTQASILVSACVTTAASKVSCLSRLMWPQDTCCHCKEIAWLWVAGKCHRERHPPTSVRLLVTKAITWRTQALTLKGENSKLNERSCQKRVKTADLCNRWRSFRPCS